MGIHFKFILFHGFELEISWLKGGPGVQTGGPPPEPIWRPLVTWRRMLRTIFRHPQILQNRAGISKVPVHFGISSMDHSKEHQKLLWLISSLLETRGKPSTIVSAGRARRTCSNHTFSIQPTYAMAHSFLEHVKIHMVHSLPKLVLLVAF